MTETLFHRMVATGLTQVNVRNPHLSEAVTGIRMAKWFDPQLGEMLGQLKPHDGVPRAQVTAPVAPSDAITDTMVFEAPTNPAQRFYLPRYSIATQLTDRGSQFRIRLTRKDPGTKVSVVVQPSMAPEVAAVAADATSLSHEIVGLLSFEVPGGGMKREWTLSDRQDLPDGIELSVIVPALSDRDEVFHAMTDPTAGCQFTIRRTITVAVPTGTVQPQPGRRPMFVPLGPLIRRGQVAVEGQAGAAEPLVVGWRREPLWIPLERPPIDTPDPVRLGHIDFAGDALVRGAGQPLAGREELAGPLRGGRPFGRPLRPRPDRDGPIVVPDPTPDPAPDPAPEPLYRTTTRALDQALTPTPFVFSKDLHPYIYGDITGAGALGGLVLEQLPFAGRHHSYYYSAARPEVVYYLPDAFKLARTPEAPHAPMMSVAFESSDATLTNTAATVVFAASAVAAPARLVDAARRLATKSAVAVETMDLQPFLADSSRLTLRVSLPGSAGSSTELSGARIDLRTALSAGFKVPLEAFQSMFDRLNGADPRLFDGEVEVRLDRPDRAAEKVPLLVNMADLAGAILEVTPIRQATDPPYQVTLTNVIESPVRLNTVTAMLPQTTGPLAATLEPAPAGNTLAAGDTFTATVVPEHTPAEAEVLPALTVVDTTVTPDPAALWDAICDDTTSFLTREVTVKAPAQLFAPGPDGSQILALVIELGGLSGGLTDTVELDPTTLSAPATINTPIADLVLRTTDSGQYRYRVQTVRADRVVDGDWRTRSSQILWIVTADVA